jgi:histidine ammonia-lyase
MVANSRTIIAIEYLAAAQGIDFHHPLLTSPPLQSALARLRRDVPPLEQDRMLSGDIEIADALIRSGAMVRAAVGVALPTLSPPPGLLGE